MDKNAEHSVTQQYIVHAVGLQFVMLVHNGSPEPAELLKCISGQNRGWQWVNNITTKFTFKFGRHLSSSRHRLETKQRILPLVNGWMQRQLLCILLKLCAVWYTSLWATDIGIPRAEKRVMKFAK